MSSKNVTISKSRSRRSMRFKTDSCDDNSEESNILENSQTSNKEFEILKNSPYEEGFESISKQKKAEIETLDNEKITIKRQPKRQNFKEQKKSEKDEILKQESTIKDDKKSDLNVSVHKKRKDKKSDDESDEAIKKIEIKVKGIELEESEIDDISIKDEIIKSQEPKSEAIEIVEVKQEGGIYKSGIQASEATSTTANDVPRRSSTRSTRRKKFDDEIIDTDSPQLKPIKTLHSSIPEDSTTFYKILTPVLNDGFKNRKISDSQDSIMVTNETKATRKSQRAPNTLGSRRLLKTQKNFEIEDEKIELGISNDQELETEEEDVLFVSSENDNAYQNEPETTNGRISRISDVSVKRKSSFLSKRKLSSKKKRIIKKKKKDEKDYLEDEEDFYDFEIEETMKSASIKHRSSLSKDSVSHRFSKASKHYDSSFDDTDDEVVIPPRTEQTDFPIFSKFDDHHMFWTPEDDLKLIINVCQTNDLTKVHSQVKFTQKFSLDDITERWNLILYERVTSNISIAAIRQFHPEILHYINREALLSDNEREILQKIPSSIGICEELFQRVLLKFKKIFLSSRTADDLYKEWLKLRKLEMLCDQTDGKDKRLALLFDDETSISCSSGSNTMDSVFNHTCGYRSKMNKEELKDVHDEMCKFVEEKIRELRSLEAEVEDLLKLEASFSGIRENSFEAGVFAEIKGMRVSYKIKTMEVIIGRCSKAHEVDIDLMLEGYCNKISRFQAVINLLPNGKFMIYNCGTPKIRVDAEWIEPEEAAELRHCSFLEFEDLGFVFRINYMHVLKELDLNHLDKKVFVPKIKS